MKTYPAFDRNGKEIRVTVPPRDEDDAKAPLETDGLDIYLGSAYHAGGCQACADPARGVVVTCIRVGDLIVRLCAAHHNELKDLLGKIGTRREI